MVPIGRGVNSSKANMANFFWADNTHMQVLGGRAGQTSFFQPRDETKSDGAVSISTPVLQYTKFEKRRTKKPIRYIISRSHHLLYFTR